MYLSRLALDPRSREVRRDLGNCQDLHRTIMAAFPQVADDEARASLGVLHRVDAVRAGMTLLVQSLAVPDWSRLPSGYLLTEPETKAVSQLYEGIRAGQRLRFRLRANPTRKTATSSKADRLAGKRSNGRRVPLKEEELLNWLARKGQEGGFTLIEVEATRESDHSDGLVRHAEVRVDRPGLSQGWRSQDGSIRRLTFNPALFEGVLEVQDAVAFRRTIEEGVGPAKAYGFGLVSLAVAPS